MDAEAYILSTTLLVLVSIFLVAIAVGVSNDED